MATDLEQLVLSISADNRQMLRVLKKLEGDTGSTTRKVEKQFDQMAKRIDARLSGIGTGSFKNLIGGVTAAFGTAELIRLADIWSELKSRVDLAAGSMESGEAVMIRLSDMARRTYSGLEQTAEGWLSNATALKEMGYSTTQQLDLVETLNNALVISATKGQKAESVMDAWSKAMALGKLSGQNLNTVMQSGDRLATALADSMGVNRSALTRLGKEGKITTKEMYGVTSQLEKLRAEADSMPATVGDAVQLLKDAFLQYVGGMDQASQTSAKLAENIILLADNIDTAADTALQFSTVIISALTGRAIGGMVAALPTATASVLAMVAAMRAGTLTATGFAAALGPMGLLLGAAAGALYVLSQRQDQADIAAGEHRKSIVLLNQEIADLDYANKSAVQSTRDKIKVDIAAAKTALERAKSERELARAIVEGQVRGRTRDPELAEKIIDKQMGNSLTLFTKQVDLQQKVIEDLEKSLSTLESNVANPPQRLSLGGHSTDEGKGKKKKERVDDYERLAQRIADTTAAMVAETEVQRQLNPLVDDYGYAVAKARSEHDLLTAAKKAGVEITPKLRAEIEGLAQQYAFATVEAAKLAESQDEIRQRAEEALSTAKDATRDLIDGFVEGKSAGDMLANTLKKIGDALINDVLNNLFKIQNMGGGGGGFLSGLLGLLGGGGGGGDPWAGLRLADGGHVRGPGTSRSDSIPARLSDGEYVVNARATKQFRPLLDAINSGKALKLADGGLASFRAPTMPRLQAPASQAGPSITFAPVIDARGADVAAVERLAQVMDKQKREFEANVISTIRSARSRRVPGV
ncbi:tape measure domain-containing protein [Pseudaminobacter salicylatoxidans]|uniref:Tape measure domain-containing protein n=1 Tax=Pseudaminobacter salicylatoxidans TaxID=93369 RepID=A0A316BP52_PSESE|nr:tape measure protein [Pseudaminobacter salicylatoxidans]PWJ75290.1 tape measure domain-containing protein [Pseudaminobacter salicylatoxidans]